MRPKVSICVPNWNGMRFLEERFQTIFQQGYSDWELLVYDSGSDDGGWEYIAKLAAREPRMRVWQGPREGPYPAWNECVRRAEGDYIYIATSDDTMSSDCLGSLVLAIEKYPECDLAHCRLKVIDSEGRATGDWWEKSSLFARSSGGLFQVPHVRRAPHDGVLQIFGGTVYISFTQLLIRRSLFERVGLFESKWGSIGDFNWGMRAGLVASTVHVPGVWASWRVHERQATAAAGVGSMKHRQVIREMIDDALARTPLSPSIRKAAERVQRFSDFLEELNAISAPSDRKIWVARKVLSGCEMARIYFAAKLGGEKCSINLGISVARRWLEKCTGQKLLLEVAMNSGSAIGTVR